MKEMYPSEVLDRADEVIKLARENKWSQDELYAVIKVILAMYKEA